jgi:hypothetical protein
MCFVKFKLMLHCGTLHSGIDIDRYIIYICNHGQTQTRRRIKALFQSREINFSSFF